MKLTGKLLGSGSTRILRYIAAVVLVGWMLNGDVFMSLFNFRNIARQNSMVGLASLGMTVVLIAGGIDLSIGGMVAFCSVTVAALTKYGAAEAVAGGIGLGVALGAVNGMLALVGKIPPFVATLATLMAYRGAAMLITDSQSVPVAKTATSLIYLGRGYVLGVPVPVLVFLIVLAVLYVFIAATRAGRWMFAVGDNPRAAELTGVNVAAVRAGAYIVSGFLAGLAGVLLTARMGAGQPSGSNGWELTSLAAAVIGGASLAGGAGSVAGTALGVFVLGLIGNAITLHGGIGSYWESAVTGVFLLVVAALRRMCDTGR